MTFEVKYHCPHLNRILSFIGISIQKFINAYEKIQLKKIVREKNLDN